MIRAAILLLVTSLVLSACSWQTSNLNPRNWFGQSRTVQVEQSPEATNPLIPAKKNSALKRDEKPDLHVPIAQVSELVIERTTTGAIVRAVGIGRVQGAYAARLNPQSEDGGPVDGVMTYTFEVLYPVNPRPVGSEQSRSVVVAQNLTNQDLANIRTIRVVAQENARETKRR